MPDDAVIQADDTFRAQALRLPNEPGVYIYHDADDAVLYVGKARSLRKRVLSYLKKDAIDRKTLELVPRVVRIEAIVATSETEALLLEQNYIKRFRPPFNVRLRDDKSYPYISVTVGDEYPRVMFTRERHRRGVRYFGPYSSARAVRSTLETLNKVFPYRPVRGARRPAAARACRASITTSGRCAAPCVDLISHDDYRAVIDQVIMFLEGRTRPIERDLERRMQVAAAAQEFEEAARLRNRLTSLRTLAQRQHVDSGSSTYDVVAIAIEEGIANVQLFPVRSGRLDERRSMYLENIGESPPGELLVSFLAEYYAQQVGVPPLVVVPCELDDQEVLEEYLSERRGLAGRGARRLARREAAHARDGRAQRGARAQARGARRGAHARAPRGGARGAARGARPRGAARAHRVLRRLQHRRVAARRGHGRVRGGGAAALRTTAPSRSATRAARTTSARSARPCAGASRATGWSTRRATTARSRRSRTSS